MRDMTHRKPRYRVITDPTWPNRVTIEHADELPWISYRYEAPGDETRSYWAPSGGGYIYDVTDAPGTTGAQVCDRMAGSGDTLRWSPMHRSLAGVLRREIRLAYADEMRRNRDM